MKKLAGALALLSVSSGAVAGPKFIAYPVQVGAETVRFTKGTPTLDLQQPDGAVQITPAGIDHGSLTFAVAVYNSGKVPVNMGIENVEVYAGAQRLALFTKDQLVAKAKNRAMWAQIGVALAAGAAAYVAQENANRSYHATTFTPYGTVRTVAHWRDETAATLGTAAAVAGGAVGIKSIQDRLDETVLGLSDEIVQTTTINPDSSYAGRIVVEKIKQPKYPLDVKLAVNWNGRSYPFMFRLQSPKAPPPPAFQTLTPAGPPAVAAQTMTSAAPVLTATTNSSAVLTPAVATTTPR